MALVDEVRAVLEMPESREQLMRLFRLLHADGITDGMITRPRTVSRLALRMADHCVERQVPAFVGELPPAERTEWFARELVEMSKELSASWAL
ncbi:MAG TPA: hypothetical protein VGM88_30235 [Kofleriaceae bacterium]